MFSGLSPKFLSPYEFQGVSGSDMPMADYHRDGPRIKQPYDAFLVLDVEGTCEDGAKAFDYPNEIIASSQTYSNSLSRAHLDGHTGMAGVSFAVERQR